MSGWPVAVVLAALAWGGAMEARPQPGQATIAPGMTEEEVVQALGQPIYRRTYGEHGFYFYDNGCEKECGFLDFVTFRGGRVVDAVFRHPDRRYAGESSSPKGVKPKPSVTGEPPAAGAGAAPPGGTSSR